MLLWWLVLASLLLLLSVLLLLCYDCIIIVITIVDIIIVTTKTNILLTRCQLGIPEKEEWEKAMVEASPGCTDTMGMASGSLTADTSPTSTTRSLAVPSARSRVSRVGSGVSTKQNPSLVGEDVGDAYLLRLEIKDLKDALAEKEADVEEMSNIFDTMLGEKELLEDELIRTVEQQEIKDKKGCSECAKLRQENACLRAER